MSESDARKLPVVGGLTGGLANLNPGDNGTDVAGLDASNLLNAGDFDEETGSADDSDAEQDGGTA